METTFPHSNSERAEFLPADATYSNQGPSFSHCPIVQSLVLIATIVHQFHKGSRYKGFLEGNQRQMELLHALVHPCLLVNHNCPVLLVSSHHRLALKIPSEKMKKNKQTSNSLNRLPKYVKLQQKNNEDCSGVLFM